MTENEIAQQIVDVAYRLHRALGPGLLESVYETIVATELTKRGLHVVRQAQIPITFEGATFEAGFRADLLVEDRVIVEIKCVSEVIPVHKKQLMTYLKLADKRLGLLINFNEFFIKNGIVRMVNGLEE